MPNKLIDSKILGKSSYMGPAIIMAIEDRRVQLECPDEFPWARMAIAQTYEPVVGDEVLTLSNGKDWFVIGLLDGRGRTTFTAPGDIEIHAPNGRIDLLAGQGIRLGSELVEITANKLEMSARNVLQRFADVTQWITGALHRRIGRMSTKVESDYQLKADRIVERADGDVIVNGKMIHLN